MKAETYAFISDVKEKKVTARSARHTRTHCGKGGRVRLPSDNLSKKELKKMSGECKSFRLNDPMTREELLAMPDDLKIAYIKAIRNKYGTPDSHLAKALGFTQQRFAKLVNRLGISRGKAAGGHFKWDKEGFFAWWYGVEKLPTPVPEEHTEVPVIEEVPIEEPSQEEPEFFVEDDLPFDMVPAKEPEPSYPKLPELHYALCAEIDELKKRGDELLKSNEELMAANEKYKAENAWMRNEWENDNIQLRILEAQMEVVRLIFGGKNNG